MIGGIVTTMSLMYGRCMQNPIQNTDMYTDIVLLRCYSHTKARRDTNRKTLGQHQR